MYHTLVRLGHPPEKIAVHLLQKGTNIHCDSERDRLIGHRPERLIVLDQGSCPGRALIPSTLGIPGPSTLIIDHHVSEKVRIRLCALTLVAGRCPHTYCLQLVTDRNNVAAGLHAA